ncbi:PIN domain-containing protein [Chryseobacterium daecheongense]|nr:PIN domain-containing protein [Chryseobacterium daecheongense]
MKKNNNEDVPQKIDDKSTQTESVENEVEKVSDFINSLIFIDTNVFLDFYRIRNSDVSIKLLDEILKHKDSIIITTQIEMEFKKNRQIVFGQTYTELIKTRNFSLSLPHILTVEEEVKDFNETKKKLNDYQSKLEDKFAAILTNPLEHDQVYKKLEEIFVHKSEFNLNRDNIANTVIAEAARKRFDLGYPPRKDSDNSIGDAINWEWIIQCAKTSGKSVIIITRDSDYGYIFKQEPHLNDWLAQEFKDRVNSENSIFLTNKLTKAFEIVKIEVTKEMVEEEQKIISNNDEWQYQSVRDRESSWQTSKRLGEEIYGSQNNLFKTWESLGTVQKPNMAQFLSPSWKTVMEASQPQSYMRMLNNINSWNDQSKKWPFNPTNLGL